MSLKNDIMYPFGDPIVEIFDRRTMVALNNVLNLAKERIWLADDRPGGLTSEFSDLLDYEDITNATGSVEIVTTLIKQINKHNN